MAQGLEASEQQNGVAAFVGLTPQVVVQATKAEEAVQFYKAAFGAEEVKRSMQPKRKAEQELPLILCAELKIGSSSLIVCDQTEDSAPTVDKDAGKSGIVFRLETKDVHGAVNRAVKAGAELDGEIIEQEGTCCGGVLGKIKDPFGLSWLIASAPKPKACAVAAADEAGA